MAPNRKDETFVDKIIQTVNLLSRGHSRICSIKKIKQPEVNKCGKS